MLDFSYIISVLFTFTTSTTSLLYSVQKKHPPLVSQYMSDTLKPIQMKFNPVLAENLQTKST